MNLPHKSLYVWLSCLAIGLGPFNAWSASQTDVLDFATNGHNMWGSGASIAMNEVWDDLLFSFGDSRTVDTTIAGSGVSFDFSYAGRAGLEARLQIDTGSVNVAYPLSLSVPLPDFVRQGEQFFIDTSDWAHLASSLTTSGPAARFTLDAIFELATTIGPGLIELVGIDLVNFDAITLPGINRRDTLIDIGSGASSLSFDLGDLATVTLSVPEQLTTESTTLIPPELKQLQASATGDDTFLNMNVDLDAIVQQLFGLPGDFLEAEAVIFGDDDNDGMDDLAFNATLLNIAADLGLKFSQQFTFQPQAIQAVLTASDGQVQAGNLGDVFAFVAPNTAGDFDIVAEFNLISQLHNETGFVASASLGVQALELVMHNEKLVDFDVNLASDVLGLGSDFLIDLTIPPGGLNSAPLFLYDEIFALGGFNPQQAVYTIHVVPEPATLTLLVAGFIALAAYRRPRHPSYSPM